MSLETLMGTTAKIERPKLTSVDSAWTTVVASVQCDIQSGRGRFIRSRLGERTDAGYLGIFPMGTDLREGDRVTAGSVKYEVRFVDEIRGHHLEATLERTLG